MKKIFQKVKKLIPKTTKYFFDFIGVFLAFWLNARKEEENKKEEQVQIYQAIFEDLNSFHDSGKREFDEGFINLFENYKSKLDSLIAIKEIPANLRFYGDYWHLEIINSLVVSGSLSNMDPKVFKGVGKLHSSHLMFLDEIKSFNEKYEKYITANYENGMDFYYKPNSKELKERFKIPFKHLDRIISLAETLVDGAEIAKNELVDEYNFE